MNKKQKQEWEQACISDINRYGIYCQGLSEMEIMEYLKIRSKDSSNGNNFLYSLTNKFYKIAGENTVASITLEDGTKKQLMCRHDVERFCSVLFDNKQNYWD